MLPIQIESMLSFLRNERWIQELSKTSEIFIVGGCVRDAFINKDSKDIDLIVNGLSYDGILKVINKFGKTKLSGESFSVIKFKPKGFKGEDYDIAIPRRDRKVSSGHKGFSVETDGVTVIEDLKRRDFTINSIAVNVTTGEILDPFNGITDLKKGLISATDKSAFVEDALRILRGIQFAARFNFDIEADTLKLMKDNAHLIKEIASERLLEEFNKIIFKGGGNINKTISLLNKSGLSKYILGSNSVAPVKYDSVDLLSFYYILGDLSNKRPSDFYLHELSGNRKIVRALDMLGILLSEHANSKSDNEDLRYMLFKMVQKSPIIKHCDILSIPMKDVLYSMEIGEIPSSNNDILVNGNEISNILDIEGELLGKTIERLRRDALMNKFNWKDKDSTINHLHEINN